MATEWTNRLLALKWQFILFGCLIHLASALPKDEKEAQDETVSYRPEKHQTEELFSLTILHTDAFITDNEKRFTREHSGHRKILSHSKNSDSSSYTRHRNHHLYRREHHSSHFKGVGDNIEKTHKFNNFGMKVTPNNTWIEVTEQDNVHSNLKKHRKHNHRPSSKSLNLKKQSLHHHSKCIENCKESGSSWIRSRKTRRHDRHTAFYSNHKHFSQEVERKKQPQFDPNSPSFVEAQVLGSAFLPCSIHNLGDKTVSWVRNKDAHILAVDSDTFIADQRFVSLLDSQSDTWTLQIKYVEKSDAGRYECQVTTEPKMSKFVNLHVVVPNVVIPGGEELHVRSGSDVELKCVISKALMPPPHVFWYHEDRHVLDGLKRGLVRQVPIKIISNDSSVATLILRKADRSHAGSYTCAPSGLNSNASVILHVLNGEHPAGLQSAASSPHRHSTYCLWLSSFIFILYIS